MTSSASVNHALEFLKAWWFLVAFSLTGIGVVITMWFKLEYVIATVDPAAVLEFRVKEALLDQKRDMRWCLGKVVIQDTFTKKEILDCAD